MRFFAVPRVESGRGSSLRPTYDALPSLFARAEPCMLWSLTIDTSPAVCHGGGPAPFRAPALSMPPSDVELMQRAQSGDADAFAVIYDRHAGALLALAQRMLGGGGLGRAEALDLLHDVFLEAWQQVRTYDAARALPRTWLLVRLRSRALDRRARAARGASVVAQIEAVPALNALVAPVGAQDERQAAIAQALGALDDDVRSALELTYFEGLTAPEISARTGIPIGTVRSRLARGLERLRALLQVLEKGAAHD
jgi:RNA polymerase sigma-70 factor (ECF subfamily)